MDMFGNCFVSSFECVFLQVLSSFCLLSSLLVPSDRQAGLGLSFCITCDESTQKKFFVCVSMVFCLAFQEMVRSFNVEFVSLEFLAILNFRGYGMTFFCGRLACCVLTKP